MENKTQREKNSDYTNRKRIIERTVDLIRLGFEDNFISARTGLEEYRVSFIREMIEEEEEE